MPESRTVLRSPDSEARPVVLVVDDAPSTLGLLCDVLEQSGYSVRVAQDGASALQRLKMLAVDAVLLDALMPGLSGFETCRLIKADEGLAHIPVIFMTGLSDTTHVLQGFACGGVDYVTKPLRAEEVLARLNAHVRNAKLARLSREAMDVAGFGVLLLDRQGEIAWRSPGASRWLLEYSGNQSCASLPTAWRAAVGEDLRISSPRRPTLSLVIKNLGPVAQGETLYLLSQSSLEGSSSSQLNRAALTSREAEVLSWLSKGKTNRDIAEILAISHRTVNKHLEHLFEKLGVETRSAAAAIGAMHSRG
ncbi:DNA-binding response regulator [Paucibacter sp. KBW04]|uniref:response regulator transcription factor n=1 Tax=Paucibacter sp. KBW04 TaxID=2153361 RepID=UPI000F574E00|nr:response regulator transcription factor [Paucibacter sp. KBW04]RQO61333.1 DNA-binding response regulator [Paucibacter sp. KBW04]